MQTARPLTKPNKQRKRLYQAPAHVRHKLLAAHLSPELRATHIAKSIPVRSGDTIRVMRGDHKGFEGKVTRIDLKKYRVYMEGLTREKVDGTTIFVAVHPSKLIITRLNLDDKWRKRILERKRKPQKRPQKPLKMPKPEPVEKPSETAELEQPSEEKVAEEKAVVTLKRPPKRRVSKPRKKTKKTATEKKEAQVAETKAEKKPKVQRKRTRRKSIKKTEEGEG